MSKVFSDFHIDFHQGFLVDLKIENEKRLSEIKSPAGCLCKKHCILDDSSLSILTQLLQLLDTYNIFDTSN